MVTSMADICGWPVSGSTPNALTKLLTFTATNPCVSETAPGPHRIVDPRSAFDRARIRTQHHEHAVRDGEALGIARVHDDIGRLERVVLRSRQAARSSRGATGAG